MDGSAMKGDEVIMFRAYMEYLEAKAKEKE